MSGFEVTDGQLRRVAHVVDLARQSAAAVKVADGLDAIATALPGAGQSSTQAEELARQWQVTATACLGQARGYGEALVAAADGYVSTDQVSHQNLTSAWLPASDPQAPNPSGLRLWTTFPGRSQ